MKILLRLIIGLILAAFLFLLWFSHKPATRLVDASGKQLTAGGVLGPAEEVFGGAVFKGVHALIEGKQFAEAKEKLLQIIEESERDGEACVLLCDVSRELEDVEAAVDYGLKAVGLLPNSARAHLSYAEALAVQIASDMQSLGGMLGAMKRLGLFKAEIDRVIELDPEDTEARKMLVYYYVPPGPFGNLDKAIEVAREIEQRDPISGMQLLAICYQRKKETQRAIEICLSGIKEYPNAQSLHVTLADIYATEKRFDDADAEYEAARRGAKDGTYYRALYYQALMRIKNEYEPARAVELLDEFIAGEPEGDGVPEVTYACWRKGNALEQLGRIQDARAAYQESLRRQPGLERAEKALRALEG